MKTIEKPHFIEVVPDEGCFLTNWGEEMDIVDYYSTTIVYAPKGRPIEWYDISTEEDAAKQAAREAEIEARKEAAEQIEESVEE